MPLTKRFRGYSRRMLESVIGAHIFRHVPYQSFYPELAEQDWKDEAVVFDVGANRGQSVSDIRPFLPRARIFSFEPVAATFQLLQQRVARDPLAEAFRLALGETVGPAEIFVGKHSSMSSFHAHWGPATGKEEVETSTVDRMVERLQVPRIHLLKIDTEGHELEVLKGAEASLRTGRITFIQAEVRFDQTFRRGTHPSRAGVDALRSFLAPLDYQLHGFYNFIKRSYSDPSLTRRGGGVLAYCDAVFRYCPGSSKVPPSDLP